MIDTHCHIDLYKNPLQIVKESEAKGIITIGMTNLPSHFEMGLPHILPFKKVRLALGLHPLHALEHFREFEGFIRNLTKTSYIGEIGLDFSREGISTKELQVSSFIKILKELKGKKKILSIHSRKAEKHVLKYLKEYKIKTAIFHWYSGPLALIDDIANSGYYFSVNTAMIKSEAGAKIIKRIPLNKVLTETDGPFIEHKGKQVKPCDVKIVEDYLSILWQKTETEVSSIIKNNFAKIISEIK